MPKILRVILALCTLLGGLAFSQNGQAATTNAANFTVVPVYPTNQVGGQLGYFQLQVRPNQTGKLKLRLVNYGPTSQSLTITPTNATTNDNGQIDYSPSKRPLDPSSQANLAHLFTARRTVTVPANQAKVVQFNYHIPSKGIRGILLGSLYVYSNTRKSNQTGNVINRYALAIGVSLSAHPRQRPLPQLRMGAATVTNTRSNIVVKMRLRNIQPTYFRGMRMTTRVTKAGQSRTLYQQKLTNGAMAPNSYFNYPLGLGKQVTQPGNYLAHITIKARHRTWHFTRSFKISPLNSAKKITHVDNHQDWWLLLLLIPLILVGGLFYWLGTRKTRQQ